MCQLMGGCQYAKQLPLLLLHPNAVRRPGVCLEAVWKESIALTQPLYSPSTHRLLTSLSDWETFAEKDTLVLISVCISVTLWGLNNSFLRRLFFSPRQVKFMFEEKIVIVSDWGHGDMRGRNHLCSFLPKSNFRSQIGIWDLSFVFVELMCFVLGFFFLRSYFHSLVCCLMEYIKFLAEAVSE